MENEKLLSKKEREQIKQLRIEQKDERNVSLANAAKARGFELMMFLYAVSIVVLALADLITVSAFFILLSVLVVCVSYFVLRLRNYHKDC